MHARQGFGLSRHLYSWHRFGDEFRPVQLELHVLGFPGGENNKEAFKFDNNLNYR
jgi:hypothetical protein